MNKYAIIMTPANGRPIATGIMDDVTINKIDFDDIKTEITHNPNHKLYRLRHLPFEFAKHVEPVTGKYFLSSLYIDPDQSIFECEESVFSEVLNDLESVENFVKEIEEPSVCLYELCEEVNT